MLKFVTAFCAAVIAGWALVGSATDASAGYGNRGCCGPIAPSYSVTTKKVYKSYTHYHDKYRTKYVKRIHRYVHVTRIQPIIHIRKVTRIHTNIVGIVYPIHQRVTQRLPARTYVTSSVVHLRPHCACAYRHGY